MATNSSGRIGKEIIGGCGEEKGQGGQIIFRTGGTPKGKTDSQQDAGIFNPGAGDALQIQDEEKQIQDAFCDNKKNRFFGHDIVLSQVWIL